MNNDVTDPNAGNADVPSSDPSDLGSQDGNGTQPSGNPVGQDGGQNPNQGTDEIAKYKNENRILNAKIVELQRNANRNNGANPQGQGDNPFESPVGQYAISLQLATGQLSQKLENVYSLYPEIPATEIARIRKNPWAFASQESYMAGDVDTAMLEIEQNLLDRAEELSAADGTQNPNANGQPKPATINNNPTPEMAADDAEPGSEEDQNPWTMPMDKLAKVKNKEVAKLTKK